MSFNQAALWRKSSYSGNGGQCVEVGAWRKSSHSGNGGDCVEVGTWRKSSYSANGGECVEVGAAECVGVRDTKQAHLGAARAVLMVDRSVFVSFIARVKSGALDI
ncbi:DUF397 domain-containing protein [Streptoalloteichus hindustanus]|uniref:DUF397 domain-containing protein n=1 Tax=Streptoalloteichus hindustanus TaxID=2017 RepID=A0A1M5L7T6_STRHI|nr:DUF397 domain-containing protein [Streptoalloteichus hindustanus]SHG60809.1 protein of unknown function [Streptoalloteichus hindustanus]